MAFECEVAGSRVAVMPVARARRVRRIGLNIVGILFLSCFTAGYW